VQASKIGSIVEQVPGEHAIELLAKRLAADFDTSGEVGECLLEVLVESEVPEVRMGIDAARIALCDLQ